MLWFEPDFLLTKFYAYIVGISQKITMNKRAKSNSIRLIAGQWRGRKLPVVDHVGLRPTADRVRETLFNWLMYDVQAAQCLDLFAGTGALGLEALSRGAKFVQFVEQDKTVASALAKSLDTLNCERNRYAVGVESAAQFLANSPKEPFDVVFLDPPFALDLLPATMAALSQQGWLAKEALIYIEEPLKQDAVAVPNEWYIHRQGRTAQSRYRLCSLIER